MFQITSGKQRSAFPIRVLEIFFIQIFSASPPACRFITWTSLPHLFGFEGFILLKTSRFIVKRDLLALTSELGLCCTERRVSTLLHWAFEIALYWIIVEIGLCCTERWVSTLLHWRLRWDLINRRRRYIIIWGKNFRGWFR